MLTTSHGYAVRTRPHGNSDEVRVVEVRIGGRWESAGCVRGGNSHWRAFRDAVEFEARSRKDASVMLAEHHAAQLHGTPSRSFTPYPVAQREAQNDERDAEAYAQQYRGPGEDDGTYLAKIARTAFLEGRRTAR